MDVSLREFKATLSAVVRRVQAGESVTVTSHRQPVAVLVPPPPRGDSDVERLLAAGVITQRPRAGGLRRRAPNRLPAGSGSVAVAVIEDRG
jgi:prevent-host-death family protein